MRTIKQNEENRRFTTTMAIATIAVILLDMMMCKALGMAIATATPMIMATIAAPPSLASL